MSSKQQSFSRRNRQVDQRSHRKAFVLLTVMVTLAVASLLLYQMAMTSLGEVREVIHLERELRQRWTIVSARSLFAEHASVFLAKAQPNPQSGSPPAFRLSGKLRLNGCEVHWRIEDENTKLSIANVLKNMPPQMQWDVLSSVTNADGLRSLPTMEALRSRRLTSWNALFGGDTADAQLLLRQTDHVTLWGNGKINLLRAEPKTIEAAWRGVFGTFPPRELTNAAQSWPRPSMEDLREVLSLRESEAEKFAQWFQTSSQCFSLELELQHATAPESEGSPRSFESTSYAEGYLFVRESPVRNYGFKLN